MIEIINIENEKTKETSIDRNKVYSVKRIGKDWWRKQGCMINYNMFSFKSVKIKVDFIQSLKKTLCIN